MNMVTQQDILCLAATIWGEARGESYEGKLAIGHVVLNRLQKPGWWSRQSAADVPADTIAAVCIEPLQFSCWNAGDLNSIDVRRLAAASFQFNKLGDYDYRVCLRAALETVDAPGNDPTLGSTNYHASGSLPPWAVRKAPAAVIGRHMFYNNVT